MWQCVLVAHLQFLSSHASLKRRKSLYTIMKNHAKSEKLFIFYYLRLNCIVDKFIWTISRLENRRKFKNISKASSAHIFLEWYLINHLWRRHQTGVSKHWIMNRTFLAKIISNQSSIDFYVWSMRGLQFTRFLLSFSLKPLSLFF